MSPRRVIHSLALAALFGAAAGDGEPTHWVAGAYSFSDELGGFRIMAGTRVIADGDWRLRKAAALVKLLALEPNHRLHREKALVVTLDPAVGWRENRVEAFPEEWEPSKRLALVVSGKDAHPHTKSP